jgi:hypothetical protein
MYRSLITLCLYATIATVQQPGASPQLFITSDIAHVIPGERPGDITLVERDPVSVFTIYFYIVCTVCLLRVVIVRPEVSCMTAVCSSILR